MNHSLFVGAVALLAFPLCLRGEEARIHCPEQEDNLQTYLAMHQILFMERDTSRVAEFYAEGFISHNRDEGGGSRRRVSHDDMKAMWERGKRNSPDREIVNNLILCVDDYVIAQVTVKGTRLGPLPNLAPDEKGRYYEASAIDIYRFENGKVVERWGNNDRVTIMRQLGLLPADEPSEDR